MTMIDAVMVDPGETVDGASAINPYIEANADSMPDEALLKLWTPRSTDAVTMQGTDRASRGGVRDAARTPVAIRVSEPAQREREPEAGVLCRATLVWLTPEARTEMRQILLGQLWRFVVDANEVRVLFVVSSLIDRTIHRAAGRRIVDCIAQQVGENALEDADITVHPKPPPVVAQRQRDLVGLGRDGAWFRSESRPVEPDPTDPAPVIPDRIRISPSASSVSTLRCMRSVAAIAVIRPLRKAALSPSLRATSAVTRVSAKGVRSS